jgi:ribosomal-protein-alanine N-acetyltransferase
MSTPILTTGRLILRPPVAEDARAIANILNDWEVTQWLTMVPFPYARADAVEFLDRLFANSDLSYWLIEIEGEVVGAISLRPDLGFFLAPKAQGNGHMTEAARAVLTWHFSQSDETAVSGYHVGNTASARVQEKLGFRTTHKATHRKASTGEDITVIKTALSKADWEARHV